VRHLSRSTVEPQRGGATLLRELVPADGLRDRVAATLTAADDLLTDRIAGSYRRLVEFFGFRATTDYRTLAR
jgi:hypothetical protein